MISVRQHGANMPFEKGNNQQALRKTRKGGTLEPKYIREVARSKFMERLPELLRRMIASKNHTVYIRGMALLAKVGLPEQLEVKQEYETIISPAAQVVQVLIDARVSVEVWPPSLRELWQSGRLEGVTMPDAVGPTVDHVIEDKPTALE